MKIVVVAGEVLKREMQSKPVNADIEFIWVNDPDELKKNPDADACFDLEFINNDVRIKRLKQFSPKPVFINSVLYSLAETNSFFIRINAWPTFLKRIICETAAKEDRENAAKKIFDAMGWANRFVPDVKGMVSARIVAMIVNEAYYTLEAGVSSKAEIDIAMKLGTNYPYGPFEWSEKIGLKNIYALLIELGKTDQRYLVSTALQEEVSGGSMSPV